MTLQEYLEEAPKNRIIYIGSGSAFLVVGYVDKKLKYKDLKNPVLSEQIEKMDVEIWEAYQKVQAKRVGRYERLLKEQGEDAEDTIYAKYDVDNNPPPVSLFRRRVIQIWERVEEDAINVQVEGSEHGKYWSIHEGDPFSINYNDEQLVGAVFRDVVRDYKNVFGAELRTLKQLLDRLEKYMDESRGYERYIKYLCGEEAFTEKNGRKTKFPTKLFGVVSPEVIINKARSEVAETLKGRDAEPEQSRQT